MMAPNWKYSECKTTRNMAHMTPKIHQLTYKYPFGEYEGTQHEDTLLGGNQGKVEQ